MKITASLRGSRVATSALTLYGIGCLLIGMGLGAAAVLRWVDDKP